MKYQTVIILGLVLFFQQCSAPSEKDKMNVSGMRTLPRVLFITTGISGEETRLPQGIVIAIQSFNKSGVPVRLESRDILYNFDKLSRYNILILSTFPGYHDADRKYSLSYLSDDELHNLTQFVKEGGILISGENIGRNYPDGTDRISKFQQLDPENWELSKCYGVTLSERNMTNFGMKGRITSDFQWEIPSELLSDADHELWTLVPEKVISSNYKVLGYWINRTDSASSVIENKYEKGMSYFLSFSGFLHPKSNGGYWSEDQINKFYEYVLDKYNEINNIKIMLNPWPLGYDFAFCVSLNAEGTIDQYERVFHLLDYEKIKPTVFVKGLKNAEMKTYLKLKSFPLASNGFSYSNYNDFTYPQTVEDILRNENYWDVDFTGFRFPFTNPGYRGMLALDEHHYIFDSSIGANNLDFFHGSVVPYNIVIADNGFYRSTNMLEIAPTYHDDYYFLNEINKDHSPDSSKLMKDLQIYRKYLLNYWNYAVKPYNGLMVYLGHPQFVGYNDTTLTALGNLIREIKKENCWVTTMDEIAGFRINLAKLQFFLEIDHEKQKIHIIAPDNNVVKEACLNFTVQIKDASAKKGQVKIIENGKGQQLIFDAFNGQTLTIQLK
jgi:hypothetical protein